MSSVLCPLSYLTIVWWKRLDSNQQGHYGNCFTDSNATRYVLHFLTHSNAVYIKFGAGTRDRTEVHGLEGRNSAS